MEALIAGPVDVDVGIGVQPSSLDGRPRLLHEMELSVVETGESEQAATRGALGLPDQRMGTGTGLQEE